MIRFGEFLLAGLVLSGCGSYGTTAHEYAARACDAYREVARDQVASTKAQADAVVEVARSDVRAAAAFDPRWGSLSSDMQSALELMETGADRFFRVDRQVQDDCQDAGRDIGDLQP